MADGRLPLDGICLDRIEVPAEGAERDQDIAMRMPLALQAEMKIGVIEIADLGNFTQAQAGTRMRFLDCDQKFYA